MEEIEDGLRNLLIKVLIPALVAVSIKIAIDSRKKTVSIFSIIASIVTGVGMAYLFSEPVLSYCSDDWIPLMIALIAISGEKIGNWMINKFNVDMFIEALIERYYRK